MTAPPLPVPPDGRIARPLSVDDAPAVAELMAAWERAEPTDNSYTETEIREEFTAPIAALDGGGIAVLEGGRLVGYGLLHVVAREPEWVAFADGGVHPDRHRRGIGRWLLDRQIDQARRLHASSAPERPAELRVGAAEGRIGTRALLTSAGFATARYFFRMRTDLRGGVPFPPADPAGVRIRPYVAADEEAARLVSNAAFIDHWGSAPREPDGWRAEFSAASSFRPDACFVAEDTTEPGGPLVAFVFALEHEADTARRGYRTGYVSRIGTLRAARGRGIGAALMAHTVAAMAAQGYAEAELHVDADSPTGAGRLYSRLGFEVGDRERLLTRRLQ